MFSDNTLGYKVANDYFSSAFLLQPERFRSLLCENVVMLHNSNENEYREEGIENVFKVYKEKLFDVTLTVDLIYSSIEANAFEPELRCTVIETKRAEDGTTFVARYIDHTILKLVYEDGELKIREIHTEAIKIVLSLS